MVNVLVAAGADINAKHWLGSTPLHVVASNNRDADIAASAIVDILVAGGAKVDATDAKGRTPLHLAALRGNSLAVERLILAEADVELLDVRENLKVMLEAGADINARDHQGRTPLHYAAQLRTSRTAKHLISAGA
ncbi:hypothetical protein BOTBODRAFT_137572, partial [Botryobasidium botryosum FD-172 SS1]